MHKRYLALILAFVAMLLTGCGSEAEVRALNSLDWDGKLPQYSKEIKRILDTEEVNYLDLKILADSEVRDQHLGPVSNYVLYSFDNRRDGKHYLYLTMVEWKDGKASIPYKYVYGGFRPKDEKIVTASEAMNAYDSTRGGGQQNLLYGEFLDDRADSVLFIDSSGEKKEAFRGQGGYILTDIFVLASRLEILDKAGNILKVFEAEDLEVA